MKCHGSKDQTVTYSVAVILVGLLWEAQTSSVISCNFVVHYVGKNVMKSEMSSIHRSNSNLPRV